MYAGVLRPALSKIMENSSRYRDIGSSVDDLFFVDAVGLRRNSANQQMIRHCQSEGASNAMTTRIGTEMRKLLGCDAVLGASDMRLFGINAFELIPIAERRAGPGAGDNMQELVTRNLLDSARVVQYRAFAENAGHSVRTHDQHYQGMVLKESTKGMYKMTMAMYRGLHAVYGADFDPKEMRMMEEEVCVSV